MVDVPQLSSVRALTEDMGVEGSRSGDGFSLGLHKFLALLQNRVFALALSLGADRHWNTMLC